MAGRARGSSASPPILVKRGNSGPDPRERLVIVGFGMVGFKFVERLKALGALERYAVTVVGEEPRPAYDRVRLTEWLDHRDSGRLALGGAGWSERSGIRVITGDPAVSLDRGRRSVRTASGEQVSYDRLVLATGSAARRVPIEGADLDGVFVYRTLDDLERIAGRAADAKSAIVLGGGLLGLETADALRRLGLEVTVVEVASHLLKSQLDEDGGEILGRSIQRFGLRVLVGASARRIEARDNGLALFLDGSGEPLTSDLIVMAAGVRPRDELARSAGLAVGPGPGGVVVDDQLRTRDCAIHAIGDCARHKGARYGVVAPGYRMAETLARVLAGERTRFRPCASAFRLRFLGVDLWAMGVPDSTGEQACWAQGDAHFQITVRGGRMVAASSLGPWREVGIAQDFIRRGRRIWPWQVRRFERTGSLPGYSRQAPVAEWPPSALVCNCLEIPRGTLSAAAAGGCSSVRALAETTGASSVCGSCRPLLAELIGAPAGAVRFEGRRGLLAAAAAAVVLAFWIALGTPIPLASRLEAQGVWDILYRDGFWRQTTGFGLLGMVLIPTLGFSLAKRWRRACPESDSWRLGHAAFSALALLGLVAHTGMRLGSGFNQLLTISFLAATVFGAAAAAGFGQRHARLTFWLHVFAVWPLPVLLAFHILASYYF